VGVCHVAKVEGGRARGGAEEATAEWGRAPCLYDGDLRDVITRAEC